MISASEDQIHIIGNVLNDENRPLKERFRALFTLKNIGGGIAINCISTCFKDSSALLKHELAYCLGQMQNEDANHILIEVLKDVKQEPMVRHEAGMFNNSNINLKIIFFILAEALGAIGTIDSVAILEQYKNDSVIEVSETCELALERIKWLQNSKNEELSDSGFTSVDPAPPAKETNITNLKKILLSHNETLFHRYRAMFALRNIGSAEAIEALGAALKCGSALFKHEIAFVLGQLQDEAGVTYLVECLHDQNENEMVRHESAEALGAIATEYCFDVLKKYLNDDKQIVKESCEIALDMCEYENSTEFQYANALQIIS